MPELPHDKPDVTVITSSPAPYRLDALTNTGNLLSFVEWLVATLSHGEQTAWSLLVLDINHLSHLNATKGRQVGDQVLRWVSLVAQDESRSRVYRIGNDEFAVPLQGGTAGDRLTVAERICARLDTEAAGQEVARPVVSAQVVHYPAGEAVTPADVFSHLAASLHARSTEPTAGPEARSVAELQSRSYPAEVRWMTDLLLDRLVNLGEMLEASHQQAHRDPLTGLPNSRAAEAALRQALQETTRRGQPLSLLFIDGDDLHAYNDISYAAGDEMICQLGETLRSSLRPADFLARWRTGDEFLVILPDADVERAREAGERLAEAVGLTSRAWRHPVTISIGVASHPRHGRTPEALLTRAEAGLNRAKATGKNRVVVAEG